VARFPTSKSTDTLVEPFRSSINRFLAALNAGGARVAIEATLRPPERAYLMHYAFRIAREGFNPAEADPKAGVEIQWMHRDPQGNPDVPASRAAAERMVQGYGIVYRPATKSNHIAGKAIDMVVNWQGDLVVANSYGALVRIGSLPRDGARNPELHRVAATYGVLKLVSDPPHWSMDGR
jgi:hypothetical protein